MYRFYWFINVGALVAYSAVGYIQQEVSFAWGFLVPLLSMMVALVIFICSRRFYEHLPPQGTAPVELHSNKTTSQYLVLQYTLLIYLFISFTMKICTEKRKEKKRRKPPPPRPPPEKQQKTTTATSITTTYFFIFHLCFIGSVLTTAIKICRAGCKKSPSPGQKLKYFDKARASRGGRFDDYTVDGVICVLRVLPTFVLVVVYWAIYSQVRHRHNSTHWSHQSLDHY